jgi:hypothetical protein
MSQIIKQQMQTGYSAIKVTFMKRCIARINQVSPLFIKLGVNLPLTRQSGLVL